MLAICWPTAARMEQLAMVVTLLSRPAAMALAKRASSASTARSAWSLVQAKQMECSDDACEIMTTLTPASRTHEKMLDAVPGTPTMPVPSTLISVTFSMVANPFTSALEGERAPTAAAARCSARSGRYSAMRVPGAERLKKLRMAMGMLYFMAGSVVRGCSTLAPK